MKTEFLKGLGLDQNVIDQIMAENGRDVEAEKSKTTAKEGELQKANETIQGLQETVKKYDGKDPTKLEQDLRDLQQKYDADIKAEQVKAGTIQREFVLKDALRNVGVADPDYLIYKHGGVDKFAFADDKPVGLDDTIKPYKESSPHLFAEEKPPVRTGMRQAGTEGAADKNSEINAGFRSILGKE